MVCLICVLGFCIGRVDLRVHPLVSALYPVSLSAPHKGGFKQSAHARDAGMLFSILRTPWLPDTSVVAFAEQAAQEWHL